MMMMMEGGRDAEEKSEKSRWTQPVSDQRQEEREREENSTGGGDHLKIHLKLHVKGYLNHFPDFDCDARER